MEMPTNVKTYYILTDIRFQITNKFLPELFSNILKMNLYDLTNLIIYYRNNNDMHKKEIYIRNYRETNKRKWSKKKHYLNIDDELIICTIYLDKEWK